MKTYKERTDSILKKVRILKRRRARICISAISSCFVLLISIAIVGLIGGVQANGKADGNEAGAPEYAESTADFAPSMSVDEWESKNDSDSDDTSEVSSDESSESCSDTES